MNKTETMRRNDAYLASFERLLHSEGGAGTVEELKALAVRAAGMRPPRYFVSLRRAHEVYRAHCNGRKLPPGLWREFCEDVDVELKARPRLGQARAMNFVLCFKRPSHYYISPETAWRLIVSRMDRCVALRRKRSPRLNHTERKGAE